MESNHHCNDPDVTLTDNDEPDINHGRWSRQEHSLFIEGLVKCGNNWKKVQKNIGSRSSTQARSHAQKFFLTLRKEINKGKSKEEKKKIIFNIFNNALSHLVFTPNEAFYENVEKLVYASEEDNNSEGKKKYRHHPHVNFDRSIINYQKEKIFSVQKIKKQRTNITNAQKKSNLFDLFFDSNDLSTLNNSNFNSSPNEFLLNDKDNDIMSFDIDMLLG